MATCLRCGNEWTPRKENPKKCPACQNPNWNREILRRRKVDACAVVMPDTSADDTQVLMDAVNSIRQSENKPEPENGTLSKHKAQAEELLRMIS